MSALSQEEIEAIAFEVGISPCSHCTLMCRACPRLIAVRPDLAPEYKPPAPSRPVVDPMGQAAGKYPSLWRQAKNVAGAIVEHVTAGLPNVDDETFHRRLSICERCEHFDVKQRRCTICGCAAGIKLWWAEQKCPDKPPRW